MGSTETNAPSNTTAVLDVLPSSIFGTGKVDQPVVNLWYDLDMVSDVKDPASFEEECSMLAKYAPLDLALRLLFDQITL